MSEYFSNYPKIAYDITGTNNTNPNFYASSIVGGIIPIALGYRMKL